MAETLRETVTRYADEFLLDGNDSDMSARLATAFVSANEELVFRQVGRNATHFFYMAVDSQGRLWHSHADVSGEDGTEAVPEEVGRNIVQRDDFGYFGHH